MARTCVNCNKKLQKKENEDNWTFNKRKYCDRKCYYEDMKSWKQEKKVKAMVKKNTGSKHSEARKSKTSKSVSEGLKKRWEDKEYAKAQSNSHKGKKGKIASNWQGGITKLNSKIRNSDKYKEWRKKVFIRDKYKCKECGHKGYLEAHHREAFALILRRERIKTLGDALASRRLWLVSNGETLCKPCHKKTDTYLINYIKQNG